MPLISTSSAGVDTATFRPNADRSGVARLNRRRGIAPIELLLTLLTMVLLLYVAFGVADMVRTKLLVDKTAYREMRRGTEVGLLGEVLQRTAVDRARETKFVAELTKERQHIAAARVRQLSQNLRFRGGYKPPEWLRIDGLPNTFAGGLHAESSSPVVGSYATSSVRGSRILEIRFAQGMATPAVLGWTWPSAGSNRMKERYQEGVDEVIPHSNSLKLDPDP